MFDNFINSFCKVQFLCYEGEPNWLGVILLFPLVIIVFGCVALLFTTVFGAIFRWLSDICVQLYNDARNVFKERPESKQSELEHLNKKQKVFRITFLPFRLIINAISWLFSVLLVLFIILVIVGLVIKLLQVIYNYIV